MVMAKFFVHLHESGTIVEDLEGIEARDLGAAVAQAVKGARAIMAADLATGSLCLTYHVEIEDADHAVVARLPFREMVSVSGL